ncbi:MAG: DUF3303 domain-containing protein [Gammaproteobacteria bacterium]
MIYLVIEHFHEGAARKAYERAIRDGRGLPEGLEYIDSWVDLDYSRCFQLMRTEDQDLLAHWQQGWTDLIRFEVIPVQTSQEAYQHFGRGAKR